MKDDIQARAVSVLADNQGQSHLHLDKKQLKGAIMTTAASCLLTCKDIEQRYRIPRSTLYQRVKDKQLPPPIKIGRSSLWDEKEFLARIEELKRARGQ